MTEDPDEFEIDDPEELSQKKRVRDILNRRNEVIEARNRATDEQLLGEASRAEAVNHYQSRLESLILDLFTKFEAFSNAEIDGEHLLYEEQIDTVYVYPPDELDVDEASIAPNEEPPEPEPVPIQGLNWFIENDPVVKARFTVESWDPPKTQTGVGTRLIPFKTLDKAFIKCVRIIDEMGIDANVQQKEQRTKIDQDLLEEVDEWRQDNVE